MTPPIRAEQAERAGDGPARPDGDGGADRLAAELRARIEDRTATVAVVGLGYVGLPLVTGAAAAGFGVVGFDVDEARVEELMGGRSPVLDVSDDEIAALVRDGRFRATNDLDALGADVVVVCVPTPLRQELPDLSHLEAAAASLASRLRPGQLVVLESTTYPGTTEEFFREALEVSGLVAGADFFLGFSPERIDPGNERYGLRNVPKIVGGIDEASSGLMTAFYGTYVERVVTVSSPRAAEMAKLVENTYRHVNIALTNEVAVLCHDLGIDVWEVIDAAATKPFGFQAFYPGPGWGGHCIPVDPAYLSWRVRQMGETARFVELAREINHRMRGYVVQRVVECLNDQGRSPRDSLVLVLGVAYKANVADVRESPAIEIISKLRRTRAEVCFHDPYVPEIRVDGTTLQRVELDPDLVARADVVVVLTAHDAYDWGWLAGQARLIFDTRNALKGRQGPICRL